MKWTIWPLYGQKTVTPGVKSTERGFLISGKLSFFFFPLTRIFFKIILRHFPRHFTSILTAHNLPRLGRLWAYSLALCEGSWLHCTSKRPLFFQAQSLHSFQLCCVCLGHMTRSDRPGFLSGNCFLAHHSQCDHSSFNLCKGVGDLLKLRMKPSFLQL